MEDYIHTHLNEVKGAMGALPVYEIGKALNEIQSVYERDGRIYIFGNGGSLALATHWVSDFNKTVFGHNIVKQKKRFQAIRLPTTEEEYSAWANDEGHDMVFAGPLQNYLRENDCVIAISSSGNSENVIRAAKVAKRQHIPVIALSGFDGGQLHHLADIKILVTTDKGRYDIVEGVHAVILHLITKYFQDSFSYARE